MQAKVSKFIAAILALVIIFANSWSVVSYAAEVFLSEKELENQNTTSKDGSVDFDVQYTNGKHSATLNIDEKNTKLNIAVSLKKSGYVKDLAIDFSSSNFEIDQINDENTNENGNAAQTTVAKKIQNFDAENKKITFGQITNKEQISEQIYINPIIKEEIGEDNFSRDNKIKLTCTFVNTDAKETKVEKEIVLHTEWTAQNVETELNYETIKYIPYASNEGNKIIVQGKVTTNVKNYVLPVKKTNINISIPQIAGEYPEKVSVINNTEEITKELNKENITYDEKNGSLTIKENNEIKNNKIQWQKNKPQKYIVTYIYSAKAYEKIKETSIKLNYKLNSEITLYSNNELTIKKEITAEQVQKEKLGEIADITLENPNEGIYKGYMYNNKVTAEENKRETEIANKYTLNIAYSNLIDSFTISQNDDKFTTSKEQEYKANTYNKELKISKQEFDNVLGVDGKIEIQSKDGTILNTIDKDTQAEQDEIKVDLTSFKIENIVLEISKPQTEGSLNFEITKAIEKDNDYSIEEIKEFTNLKSSLNVVAKNSDIAVLNETTEMVTKLEEPSQKVSIELENNRLSTVTTNEAVAIGVTLENDSIDDVMFINPNFKIIMPKYIEKLDIIAVEVMFDGELKVAETKVYDNEDGTKTIEVQLEGTQTTFNNPIAKGATIVIAADITLEKTTPTMNTEIKVIAQNGDENKTTSENKTTVKYIAPSGVVTTNSVIGYNENEKLEVVNGEAKEALIQAKSNEKELTFEMNIINNYENTLSNAVILGRTMFKGNRDVDTLQDLGTTMNIPMSSKITLSGLPEENAEIYYSTNGNATKDLSNAENAWTKEITNYAEVKSYMIVFKNYDIKSGDVFKFSYNAKAPANLDYENKAFEMYGIYFTNNISTGKIEDKAIATKIGLNTGKEAVLNAKLESVLGEGASVKAGEHLKYIVTINNNGTISAEGTTINIEIPNNLEYIPTEGENYKIRTIMPLQKFEMPEEPDWDNINWDKSEMSKEEAMAMWKQQAEQMKQQMEEYSKWVEEQKAQGVEFDENITEQKKILVIEIGNMKTNQTIKKELEFNTMHLGSDAEDEQVKLKATVEYNEDMRAETNEVTNIIKISYFNVNINANNEEKIQVGDIYECLINISTNDFENDATNVILKINLPEEMEYKSVAYEGGTTPNKVVVKGNTLQINLGTIERGKNRQLTLKLNVKDLPNGVYKKDVSITGTIEADGKNAETIPTLTDTINKIGVSIVQTCNIPANTTISAAEKYTYTFTISNLSEIPMEDVILTDKLPDEVQLKSVETIYSDGTKSTDVSVNENGEMEVNLSLGELTTANVKVEVMAKSLTKDTTITNKGKITHDKIGEIESNSITHVVELFDKNNVDPDKPSYTKKITGTVWIDKNRNGAKDADEEKVPNVTAILIDQNGNIVKNEKKSECVTTTDSDGNYLFNNLYSGTYTVVFLYESSLYSATTYRKDGVDESLNSDAIDKTIVFEGVQRIAGVTEIIKVTTFNVYNMDLGLVENTKFDLRLDKTVKVITTNNGKDVAEHTYNSKNAKIDFEAKYIAQSSMVVEYSITVTNEGGVAGYAKKIADYIPTELKFNSELNKDWYEGANGTVYNSSLANTVINPGKSKTVTLILTKNMNNDDFGVFSNSAEIYEASNNNGLLDIDSTPGNKASNEDDYSIANVIVGVKTGQAVIYVTLTMAVLIIIATGVYVIRKKVLK